MWQVQGQIGFVLSLKNVVPIRVLVQLLLIAVLDTTATTANVASHQLRRRVRLFNLRNTFAAIQLTLAEKRAVAQVSVTWSLATQHSRPGKSLAQVSISSVAIKMAGKLPLRLVSSI
jgi:hypothetical protein